VGDQWVSYQLMQPLSVQAALVGNAVEAWREAGSEPDKGADVVAKTLAKSAGSFLDQSFLSGLFDFAEAINDPERSASRFGGRLASSAIPFAGAVRTAQQAADPVVRQPKTIEETVKAGPACLNPCSRASRGLVSRWCEKAGRSVAPRIRSTCQRRWMTRCRLSCNGCLISPFSSPLEFAGTSIRPGTDPGGEKAFAGARNTVTESHFRSRRWPRRDPADS
jgi:hypothetical protein